MVSHYAWDIPFPDDLDAFGGVCAVSDDISQAYQEVA